MNNDAEKKAAGYAAAELIENGMKIGLGTGSTTAFFISRLGERCRDGLEITALASSEKSKALANSLNIPLAAPEETTYLDITVDGADEIDPAKKMIKGGGGALLREKILASMCRELIIVVDSHKKVPKLGSFPLAVEILPFAWAATIEHIKENNFQGNLRLTNWGEKYVTDNGNYIFDICLPHHKNDLEFEVIHSLLKTIPGVIETGFFSVPVACIITGKHDGKVDFER